MRHRVKAKKIRQDQTSAAVCQLGSERPIDVEGILNDTGKVRAASVFLKADNLVS